MAYTFSPDQLSIINAREQNILVSAAAGSGKTSVLTERIVGLVNDPVNPVDIDKILVVTFTNAAAKEMKERIGERLNELLAANPENKHLQKQATLIHLAQITTIDSFCLYLLKNHFHKIDVDPNFRVASESEMTLLKQDVLADVISRAYESGDEAFYHVVDCYSKKDKDNSLEESILELYTFACSYPWPEKWLEKRREDYSFNSVQALEDSELCKEIKRNITKKVLRAKEITQKALKLALAPDGPYVFEENLNKDLEDYDTIIQTVNEKPFDEAKAFFGEFKFNTLSRAKCECSKEKREAVSALRNAAKKKAQDSYKEYYSLTMADYYEDMTGTSDVVNKLIDLVLDFYYSFNQAKRERGIIDFGDMEHMAVQILVSDYEDGNHFTVTDVAKSYKEYYKEVMCDEYQDSNLVQELIIKSVSREDSDTFKNRFSVGDVKQSIYRFRLARPEIFMGKTDVYDKDEKASSRLITLKTNYRSRNSVIDAVNCVFEDIMNRECGGVDYDEDARLYFGAEYPDDTSDNQSELWLVSHEGKAAKGREVEAKAIALRILDIVGKMDVYDKKQKEMRKASFKDISVLFRAPSKWAPALRGAFEEYHIPYHLENMGAFYDTMEISEVINFLKILDNPLDDIALYASLTSFFGRFSDEECAAVKAKGGAGGRFLWNKLLAYDEFDPGNEKTEAFLNLYRKYRKRASYMPIHELMAELFDETGYVNYVAALPDGKQRKANVELLVKKACEYAATSFYGLFHFLRYVELLKKVESDEGEANTFDESSDVVKIMSIHKSKGLEFPICIMGGTDETFNDMDYKKEFVMDIDEGIGANFINPDKRYKRSTLKRNFIIEKCKQENKGEEIRVLYVGMTRAREKLIMMGLCKKPEEWLEAEEETSDNSYLAMIHKSVLKEKDRLFAINTISETELSERVMAKEIDRSVLRLNLEAGAHINDNLIAERLDERFSFDYPHKGLERLYTKTTVSELKMAEIEKIQTEDYTPFAENESREYVPIFAGGKEEVKGTDRGTAYHNLLQLIDFKKLPVTAGENDKALWGFLYGQMARMEASEEMAKEDREKVFKGKIIEFLKTDTAREMAAADLQDNLYKEQPFVIGVPASTIDDTFPEEETLLVQGVIDVYFIKDGKVTVLDYKTDRVETEEELVKRYKKQLVYYGAAIEQLTGLKCDRRVIYSFALGKTIDVGL